MYCNHKFPARGGLVLSGLLAGLLLAGPAQPVHADDEFRAGAMVQVPFDLSAKGSFFDPAAIRLGLKVQYADVEEDKIIVTRITDADTGTPLGTFVHKDDGNRVIGLEGNLFVEVFNGWNGSAELLGFAGTNSIQGAFGAGYSLSDRFFLDAKAMFPYSEIGIRFLGPLEVYGGLHTLGSFEPAQDNQVQTIPVRTILVPGP